ncbi:MAG: RsmD family RNA methyltransferase [Candidatus Omnitrophota bacterium]
MHITTGKYKGRVIRMPKGIRPTQEKVRKAFFDILGDIEGLSFLELFSGSGAVGFEAVSRGVKELILVEVDCGCRLALKKNIESLGLKTCDLYPQQADVAIRRLHREKRNFDIIFLDPPYYKGSSSCHVPKRLAGGSGLRGMTGESLSKKTLQMLEAYDILAPNGFVVVQHFKKDDLPEALGDLTLLKRSTYGDTVLSFYRKGNPNFQIPITETNHSLEFGF